MSQSSYSRDGTPVNFTRRKAHPRTNALAWPKSAIRMAKTAILSGQEMWVDGPNVLGKNEKHSDKPNYSASTISTPETIKQVLNINSQPNKAIMKSQVGDDISRLSFIYIHRKPNMNIKMKRKKNFILSQTSVKSQTNWTC